MIALALSALVLQSPATAVSVVGHVEMRLGTEVTPLVRFAEVPVTAAVKTYAASAVSLRLASGSLVRLGPDTEVVLTRLEHGSPAGKRREGFRVKAGRIWAGVLRLIGQESAFEVETDSAVAGVRGTAFFVSVGDGRARFVVDRGTVAIDAAGRSVVLDGPGASLELGAGGMSSSRLWGPTLADLRREVGGPRAVLGGGYAGWPGGLASTGGREADRRDIVGPSAVLDAALQSPAAQPPFASSAELDIRVRLPAP